VPAAPGAFEAGVSLIEVAQRLTLLVHARLKITHIGDRRVSPAAAPYGHQRSYDRSTLATPSTI
jgi:hypothetical protein